MRGAGSAGGEGGDAIVSCDCSLCGTRAVARACGEADAGDVKALKAGRLMTMQILRRRRGVWAVYDGVVSD